MSRDDTVQFLGAFKDQLTGRFVRPERPTRWAVLAGCPSCAADEAALEALAQELATIGFGVLLFDFTAEGGSAGERSRTSVASRLSDVIAAADFLRREAMAPSLLVGHSLGGAAVLAAASRVPEARAVVVLNAPADSAGFAARLRGDGTPGSAELEGRRLTVAPQLLDDLSEQDLVDEVRRLQRGLMLVYGAGDEVAGEAAARTLWEAAAEPRAMVGLPLGGHLLQRPQDGAAVGRVVTGWVSSLLGEAEGDGERQPEGTVVVANRPGRLRVDILAGQHRIVADEPDDVPGGSGLGPNPYDLLLSALGSCTAMTVRLYAERKGWPLGDVSVSLHHRRVHRDDCESCESPRARLERITRHLRVGGDLDADQRQRLLEIADRCPVHRTLSGELQIASTLEEE